MTPTTWHPSGGFFLGGRWMAKKKKTALEDAASNVLKKRNKDESKWAKEQLETAQVKFLRGEDSEIEAFVLTRAREKLVFDELKTIR